MSSSGVLKKAIFGKTQELVSRLGLGCMGMSGVYGTSSDEESIRTIHHALEIGLNFLDTADVYGAGHNEELMGKALRGKRDRVFLATKFGLSGISNTPGTLSVNGSPSYVQSACEKSLRRLGVDCIDLYYLHRLDPKTPVEETVEALSNLVRQGKIRWIGLSEVTAATLRRAYKVHPITAIQSEYSLWWTEPEKEVLPACRELGVAFVPYSPLGRGMLTGKLTDTKQLGDKDWRRISPRFQDGAFEENRKLVRAVEQIAKNKKATASQIALAWLTAQGEDIFPIPGTKRIKYLNENWESLDLHLTNEDLSALMDIVSRIHIHGERYPEHASKLIEKKTT